MAITMKLNQKGFTLIEIVVVIAIIGIVTGITSDVFIQIIKASNKANIVTEVKQNGDSVLNQLDRIIRNAEEITAAGGKNYGQSWNSNWTTIGSATITQPCSSDICAFIVKNPVSTGGYTKIEIHKEADTSAECNSSPFTASDQDTSTNPMRCNGNIRAVTDTSINALSNLQNLTDVFVRYLCLHC
jgi:prepilin-type N-terminal cleavage/methylation domain-containing protein